MKIRLFTAALLICSNVLAEDVATTLPATNPGYQTGLVCEIYNLPRRPKKMREVMPGLQAVDVHVAATPLIKSRDDLSGHLGNVQAFFIGEINIPQTGEYVFTADADDAMEAQIDGQIVISDVWVNGSKQQSKQTVSLTEGWHTFRVRFFQGDGGYRLSMRWQRPGENSFTEIDPSLFRVKQSQVELSQNKLKIDDSEVVKYPHRAVFRTRGFFELPEDEGDLLVELLEGPTNYSETALKDFNDTIKQTNYNNLPYWHQIKVLSGFLRGWYTGQTTRGQVSQFASYEIAPAVETEYNGWAGAKRKGFKHVVSMEGKDYTIYTPGIDSIERENAAKGIASLPKSLRVMLDYVTVEPYGTANEFNGGGNSIWIRRRGPTPAEMIENVISHEIGHLLMNKTDCYLDWEKAISKDILSPSQYARTNPSEDFAEFTRLYLATQGDDMKIASLRKLFPQRLPLFEENLKKVGFSW